LKRIADQPDDASIPVLVTISDDAGSGGLRGSLQERSILVWHPVAGEWRPRGSPERKDAGPQRAHWDQQHEEASFFSSPQKRKKKKKKKKRKLASRARRTDSSRGMDWRTILEF
jgi:hypothetical protein